MNLLKGLNNKIWVLINTNKLLKKYGRQIE